MHSDSGASAAFEENNGVLGFYDRKGPKDLLLDMWVLANGLTPLTKNAHDWRDAPSALLLPMSMFEKLWLYILRPLGCGLSSFYTRDWDKAQSNWVQKASHTLQIGSLFKQAETISTFDPLIGCKDLYLKCGELSWHAELSETGMIEDQGIPRWRKQIDTESQHEIR